MGAMALASWGSVGRSAVEEFSTFEDICPGCGGYERGGVAPPGSAAACELYSE